MMSKMQELYNKVAKDSVLLEEFHKMIAETEASGKAATEEKLVSFARVAGYEVSLEEMRAFFEGMVSQVKGELSDAELDQVAGGKSVKGILGIIGSCVTLGIACAMGSLVAEVPTFQGECAKLFE